MGIRNQGIGYLVASVFVVLAFMSCGEPKQPTASSEAVPIAPEPVPATVTGNIDFLEGDVSVRSSDVDWRAAEIGDVVRASDTVRTGAGSSCDIGFGPFGLVRLDADSTVELKTVFLSSEKKIASVRLAAGSVACKVSKLTGSDRFEVRTQTAVCGVRGTEFLVKEVPGKPMTVAVRTGSVAVLPPSFDADALEAATVDGAGEAMVEAVVREIVQAAPVVQANEESVVSVEKMAESERAMTEINEVVVRELETLAAAIPAPAPEATPATAPEAPSAGTAAPGAGTAAPIKEVPAAPPAPVKLSTAITATLVKYTTKSEAVIAPPAPITTESKKKLEKLPETLSAPPVPPPEIAAPSAVEPVPAAAPAAPVEAPPPPPAPVTARFVVTENEFVGGVVSLGERFFVADTQGRLYSFAADGSGKKAMKGDGASNENSRPVPIGRTVYFAGTAALVAFDVGSGNQLFARPLDPSNSGFFGRRPAVVDGKLFSSSDAGLDVYNAETGEKIGSVALGEGSDMTPVASGDSVYIVTRSGAFSIVSASERTVLASVQTKAVEPIAAGVLVVDDRAYFADRKGTAFCVDLRNKTTAWRRQLEAGKTIGVFDDPVAADKAILFFGKFGIYALSAADGTPAYAPIREVAAAPCVVGNTVWYGGRDDSFVAFDAATGKVAVKIEAGASIVGRPAVSGDHVAFPLASGAIGVVDTRRALAGGVR